MYMYIPEVVEENPMQAHHVLFITPPNKQKNTAAMDSPTPPIVYVALAAAATAAPARPTLVGRCDTWYLVISEL